MFSPFPWNSRYRSLPVQGLSGKSGQSPGGLDNYVNRMHGLPGHCPSFVLTELVNSLNQRTNGPVNAHLTSGPGIRSLSNFDQI